MCNRRVGSLCESPLVDPDQLQPHNHHPHHQAVLLMDNSPSTVSNSVPGSASTPNSNDGTQRVKFLCSFSGSILPRPQDGKLRYVGGETRIVTVPRDITYEDLMNRMKELFEGASVLKYQQPDEELDALVSVVNDDDVTNMMEEYDKLGSGDGFTRMRLFLFSHPEQDGSFHYIDRDDQNSERRYVDALNNMNDASDFRMQQLRESSIVGAVEDLHLTEHFFSPMSGDMGVPHFNLHDLKIPRIGSGQLQTEPTWSPAYYSPRHHTPHEFRADFPSSPSSTRYGTPFTGELSDEYPWQQQLIQDHHQQQQFHENVVWIPTSGAPSNGIGFPGNQLHAPSVIDGNVCEHRRMPFERNQPHMEINTQCAECPSARDNYSLMNANLKPLILAHPLEQEPRFPYNEPHSQEQGWDLAPQSNLHGEDARVHVAGAGTGRLNDYYVRDSPNMSFSIGHPTLVDGHHMSSHYVSRQVGPDLGGEVFHDPSVAGTQHIPLAYPCGVDSNVHMLPHGHHLHPQTMWRNAPNASHGVSPYEVSRPPQHLNGTAGPGFLRATADGSPGFLRATADGSPGFCIGVDGQIPRVDPSQKMFGFDGLDPALVVNKSDYFPQIHQSYSQDMLQAPQGLPTNGININEVVEVNKKDNNEEGNEATDMKELGDKVVDADPKEKSRESSTATCFRENGTGSKVVDLTEVNAAPLAGEGLQKSEAKNQDSDPANKAITSKGGGANGAEVTNTQGELEVGSDDHANNSKIEPTKAEAEAIARGLQTIKNDDLEEIRELGSGTYGAVYHGKWKGSDVAIKRIKASCFAGRPSERERLIADFWKEALILSSLHHPNVVSFYGVVRDGPDGSLATVTEFMVNGSLKQFLQKKDRTIDRRKRLIIAMDAAFGMEYLHGKNIVHFDLKCENLLVNMRDPQRPVCKIGDLGLSKVKQHTLVSGGVRGTLPWMAPELLSGKSNMVTEKIDVYSFGIVMWELLTGEEPYADMHCASIIGGIVNDSLRPQIPTWCDPEWKSLMERCWASDPSERPSFSEISQKLRSMAAAINRSRKSKKGWFGVHSHTDQVPHNEGTTLAVASPLSPRTIGGLKLSLVENEQSKHAYSVALATAVAAEAAVAAAQAAAEVVRLTSISHFSGKSKQEIAAIKIQTAFRGHMARRALRALRGLVRLRNLIQGQSVKRQAATTLQCMQTLARVQSQIRARRLRMSEENRALQRQLEQQNVKEPNKFKLGDEWDDSMQSREQIEKRLLNKQEAAMRRERALAYAFSHQQALKNSKSSNPTFMDPNNPSWGWSWLERWMAARPWETRSTCDYNDRASIKSTATSRAMSIAENTRSYSNRPSPIAQKPRGPQICSHSPSTTTSIKAPRMRQCNPKGSSWGGEDEDSRSAFSVQSEQRYFRRHSIGGSSMRDDVSLASSPPVPCYMGTTKSTKVRSRLPSPLGLDRRGSASEKASVSVGAMAKRQLSFQGSPAGPRRHSGPPKIEIGGMKGVHSGT